LLNRTVRSPLGSESLVVGSAVAGVVLGHGLGTLRDGVLGKFSGEDEV